MERYDQYLAGVTPLQSPQRTWGADGAELVVAPVHVPPQRSLGSLCRPSAPRLGTRLVDPRAESRPSPPRDRSVHLGILALFILVLVLVL